MPGETNEPIDEKEKEIETIAGYVPAWNTDSPKDRVQRLVSKFLIAFSNSGRDYIRMKKSPAKKFE